MVSKMPKTFTPEIHYVTDFRDEKVPAVDMPLDFKNADRTWEKKYGIVCPGLLVRSDKGEWYDDNRFKAIIKHGFYKTIVHKGYPVIPNEEVGSMVLEKIEQSKGQLKLVKEFDSHHGDVRYWEVLSNKLENVDKGDDVQIGCIVRNGVGTYLTLGADLFTYRLVCKNGATAKGSDLGSIAIRHSGDRNKLLESFGKGLEHIMTRTVALVEYYRQANKMKLNKKIADAWSVRIPERALPKQIEVLERGKTKVTGEPNLWQCFNDITASAWKNENRGNAMKKETSFYTKYCITNHAHAVLVAAIDGTLDKKKKQGIANQ